MIKFEVIRIHEPGNPINQPVESGGFKVFWAKNTRWILGRWGCWSSMCWASFDRGNKYQTHMGNYGNIWEIDDDDDDEDDPKITMYLGQWI